MKDGGPAFPCHPGIDNPMYDGMTLRDYFAAKAMQALISIGAYSSEYDTDAQESYAIADAMLKAREE